MVKGGEGVVKGGEGVVKGGEGVVKGGEGVVKGGEGVVKGEGPKLDKYSTQEVSCVMCGCGVQMYLKLYHRVHVKNS